MPRLKLTAACLCGLILVAGFISRGTAGGNESIAEPISFTPIETKTGWLVEGRVGNMTFHTREMTFQCSPFKAARLHAEKGYVVLSYATKGGNHGTQKGEKIQLSIWGDQPNRDP